MFTEENTLPPPPHKTYRKTLRAGVCLLALLVHPTPNSAVDDDPGILYNLAEQARSIGAYDQALVYYQQYLIFDEDIRGKLGVAECYFNMGKADLALEAYEHILEEEEDNLIAIRGLGKTLIEMGKIGEAQNAYLKAIAIAPDDIPSQNGLAVIYALQGDHIKAVNAYNLILTKAPHYRPALINKAKSLTALGRHQEAIDFLRPMALSPGATPQDRYSLAVAYGMNHQYLEASQVLAVDMSEDEVRKTLFDIIKKAEAAPVKPVYKADPFPLLPNAREEKIHLIPIAEPKANTPPPAIENEEKSQALVFERKVRAKEEPVPQVVSALPPSPSPVENTKPEVTKLVPQNHDEPTQTQSPKQTDAPTAKQEEHKSTVVAEAQQSNIRVIKDEPPVTRTFQWPLEIDSVQEAPQSNPTATPSPDESVITLVALAEERAIQERKNAEAELDRRKWKELEATAMRIIAEKDRKSVLEIERLALAEEEAARIRKQGELLVAQLSHEERVASVKRIMTETKLVTV